MSLAKTVSNMVVVAALAAAGVAQATPLFIDSFDDDHNGNTINAFNSVEEDAVDPFGSAAAIGSQRYSIFESTSPAFISADFGVGTDLLNISVGNSATGNATLIYDGSTDGSSYTGLGSLNLTGSYNSVQLAQNSGSLGSEVTVRFYDGAANSGATNYISATQNLLATAGILSLDFSSFVSNGFSGIADTLDSVGRIELAFEFVAGDELSFSALSLVNSPTASAAVPAPAGLALIGLILFGLARRHTAR